MVHELEHLIPDYLNDKLSSTAREEFERALRDNPSLAKELAAERAIQDTLRAARAPAVHFDHRAFRLKIEKDQRQPIWKTILQPWSPQVWLIAAASCVLLVSLMFVNKSTLQPTAEGDYQTLTTPVEAHATDVVRIVVSSQAELQKLIVDYNLTIRRSYPAAHTIDVEAAAMSEHTRQRLQQDKRVKLAQLIRAPQ